MGENRRRRKAVLRREKGKVIEEMKEHANRQKGGGRIKIQRRRIKMKRDKEEKGIERMERERE